MPVVLGVNWYVEFDQPQRDDRQRWWIARDGNLTRIRGEHCVCLLPYGARDPISWWNFYDQGHEGACVGFGCSRMMSLFNRRRYDALYQICGATGLEHPGIGADTRGNGFKQSIFAALCALLAPASGLAAPARDKASQERSWVAAWAAAQTNSRNSLVLRINAPDDFRP